MLIALFEKSHRITDAFPSIMITDALDAYNMPIEIAYTKSKHYVYASFVDDCSNNLLGSFNKTFKAWYKTKKEFHSFESTEDMISNFLFYYNFIHSHSSLSS